ncbi:MAG: TIGR02147 family protein, partial [Oligoflexia bacterium]|nr:TIGR02147 family protein [Oligoflexia bacterium]
RGGPSITDAAPAPVPPVLPRYQDYRAFLGDYYAYRKATRQGFSYRLFAKRAGLKSPNYLQLVIQKKRSLTEPTAGRVAAAIGLKGPERDYFVALVRRENASTPDASPQERVEAEKTHLIATRKLITRQIPQAQSRVLSEWFHLVVLEMVALRDFNPDPAWISARLRGLISEAQAEESLKLLVSGGFLETAPDGRYRARNPVLDTGDGFNEARVLQFHQQTLTMWRGLLETVGTSERQLGLLNIPISSKKVPELFRRVLAFQDEIIGWLQDEKDPDQVVQLGTYVLPVTSTPARSTAAKKSRDS